MQRMPLLSKFRLCIHLSDKRVAFELCVITKIVDLEWCYDLFWLLCSVFCQKISCGACHIKMAEAGPTRSVTKM